MRPELHSNPENLHSLASKNRRDFNPEAFARRNFPFPRIIENVWLRIKSKLVGLFCVLEYILQMTVHA